MKVNFDDVEDSLMGWFLVQAMCEDYSMILDNGGYNISLKVNGIVMDIITSMDKLDKHIDNQCSKDSDNNSYRRGYKEGIRQVKSEVYDVLDNIGEQG